jgi:hypothetical protein
MNSAERSGSGTRATRGAFKSPAQMSALPQAAKVTMSKDKEQEKEQGPAGEDFDEKKE